MRNLLPLLPAHLHPRSLRVRLPTLAAAQGARATTRTRRDFFHFTTMTGARHAPADSSRSIAATLTLAAPEEEIGRVRGGAGPRPISHAAVTPGMTAAGTLGLPLPYADVRTALSSIARPRPKHREDPAQRGGRVSQARRSGRRPVHRPTAHTNDRDASCALWPSLPPRVGRCGPPLHPRRRQAARAGAPRGPRGPARGILGGHLPAQARAAPCPCRRGAAG